MGHIAEKAQCAKWDGKIYNAAYFNEGPKEGTVCSDRAEKDRVAEEERLARKHKESQEWMREATDQTKG